MIGNNGYHTMEYVKASLNEQGSKHVKVRHTLSPLHMSEYRPLFSSLSDMHDKEHGYERKHLPEPRNVEILTILPAAPLSPKHESKLNSYNDLVYSSHYQRFPDLSAITKKQQPTVALKATPKKRLCDKCGKYFSTKSNLNRHRKRCDGGRLFYCEICGENFAMSFSLILHQRTHTKELLQANGVAGNTAEKQNDTSGGKIWDEAADSKNGIIEVKREELTNDNDKVPPPKKCIISDAEKDYVRRNADIISVVDMKPKIESISPYKYKSNGHDSSVHAHEHVNSLISRNRDIENKYNHSSNRISPERINSHEIHDEKTFTTSNYTLSEFQKAPSSTLANEGRKYECGKCWKQFSTKSNLNRHFKSCNMSILHRCKICGDTFTNSFNLKIHHENVHSSNKNNVIIKKELHYSCEICHRSFERSTELNDHMLMHEDTYYVTSSHHNDDHEIRPKIMISEHKKVDVCQKAFKSIELNDQARPADINYPMKTYQRDYRGKRRYECSKCTKRFSTKSNLNRHVKNCSGAKIFKCNVCALPFSRSVNLKIHQKIHNNDTRYQCNVCKKQCLTSYALLEHERVHTGDRPFKCDNCGRQFTTKSNWKRHQVMYSCRKNAPSSEEPQESDDADLTPSMGDIGKLSKLRNEFKENNDDDIKQEQDFESSSSSASPNSVYTDGHHNHHHHHHHHEVIQSN